VAWFTDADLKELADGRSYERGLGYVDAVADIGELPDGVVATVHGSGRYRVRLTGVDGETLAGECSCPYGQEGFFCKHCVAVGLRLLASGRPPTKQRTMSTNAEVKRFLAAMDHSELVELVWRQATEDAGLFQRLRLMIATTGDGPDLSVLDTQVAALRVDWIEYGDEHVYVSGAEAVTEALGRLVPEHAAEVQPLLRDAAAHIGAAAGACEDETGIVADAANAAWDAYLLACAAAPPDPVELGRWLVDFQLKGPDWPEIHLADLTDLLGAAGLDAYRERLAEVGPVDGEDWRLRSMREELVAETGDTDAMVAFLAEDLSGPQRYVQIAELLRAEDRTAEAVEWLERGFVGVGRSPHHAATELVDLLARLYAETGRSADVLALREKHFMSVGSSEAYRALKAVAGTGPDWPRLRDRAIALLRDRADARTWYAADTLAEVLLVEDEVDQAWTVIGRYHCDERVRLAVTRRRADTHPADAIGVYRPMVDAAVALTNNRGYEQAAGLLVTLRELYARTGGDFAAELQRLKEAHRRKRNFLAELARNGL
jgi:uncharacterized Zn finger protein